MDTNATIYLIDDEPAIVRLVTGILTNAGYRVVSFLSGEAFLAEERLSEVGCVITDLFLPGIQGMGIQAHLQRIGSPLTLIVISGLADVPTAVQLIKSGAINLLQKPFTPEDLLTAVEEGVAANLRQLTQRRRSQEIQGRLATLTEEELAITHCLVRGMSRKAVIAALNLSPRTLDRRQQSLMHKMHVETLAELIAACVVEHPFRDIQTA